MSLIDVLLLSLMNAVLCVALPKLLSLAPRISHLAPQQPVAQEKEQSKVLSFP